MRLYGKRIYWNAGKKSSRKHGGGTIRNKRHFPKEPKKRHRTIVIFPNPTFLHFGLLQKSLNKFHKAFQSCPLHVGFVLRKNFRSREKILRYWWPIKTYPSILRRLFQSLARGKMLIPRQNYPEIFFRLQQIIFCPTF